MFSSVVEVALQLSPKKARHLVQTGHQGKAQGLCTRQGGLGTPEDIGVGWEE